MQFTYSSISMADRKPAIGLIVLQSDETIESELHQWLPANEFDLLVSRVPSGEEVTKESLGEMTNHIRQSAELFPRSTCFSAVGYGCTSGTSVIGAETVSELVKAGCQTKHVTNPVSALISSCNRRGIKRLAFLSPYIESVSSHLREMIASYGIETPVFGSFNEEKENKVAWIDETSIRNATKELVSKADVEAVFLSCTNLKTRNLIEDLSTELSLPVLSSNFVMAEELRFLAKQREN